MAKPKTEPEVTMPPADPAVTMADVAALSAAPTAKPDKPAKRAPFMSEGMRHDLDTVGYTVDPVSGARFERDQETGEITVTERKPAA